MPRTGRPRKKKWAPCKVKGCDRSSKGGAFGMCHTHYMAVRRGRLDKDGRELRPMKRVASYGPGARCVVPGCGRRPKGRGLCSMHYQQWDDGVDLGVEIPQRGHDRTTISYFGEVCCVHECSERPVNRWMCSKHAQQREAGILDEDGNQLRELMPRGRRPLDWRKEDAGYILVRAPEGHPFARQDGSILQHRLLKEQEIGEYLDPDEFLVHHKNGIRDDNDPCNLEVKPYKAHGPGKDADYETARRTMLALKYNDLKSFRRLVEELWNE